MLISLESLLVLDAFKVKNLTLSIGFQILCLCVVPLVDAGTGCDSESHIGHPQD